MLLPLASLFPVIFSLLCCRLVHISHFCLFLCVAQLNVLVLDVWNTRMTMSGTCATHVLTKANPKAVWSRRLRCMQVSLCWWSVNCCVQACKQTQRDTQGTKRAKCAHVGDTNNRMYLRDPLAHVLITISPRIDTCFDARLRVIFSSGMLCISLRLSLMYPSLLC